MAIGKERGFRMRVVMAGMLRTWTSLAKGDGAVAVSGMRNGLEAYGETGARAWLPYYLALLAKAYLCAGDPEPGLSVVDEALDIAEARSEPWWNAELHRVKGQLLLSVDKMGIEDAEGCFRHALETAREQGAKAWELRAATSLARLWRAHGKEADARGVLAPVFAGFSEGLDTPDLVDARALLDELQ